MARGAQGWVSPFFVSADNETNCHWVSVPLLVWQQITDVGIQHIAASCPQLISLNLHSCTVRVFGFTLTLIALLFILVCRALWMVWVWYFVTSVGCTVHDVYSWCCCVVVNNRRVNNRCEWELYGSSVSVCVAVFSSHRRRAGCTGPDLHWIAVRQLDVVHYLLSNWVSRFVGHVVIKSLMHYMRFLLWKQEHM